MSFNDKEYSIFKGNKITMEIFGASHSEEIGVLMNGFALDNVDLNKLDEFMARRRAKKKSYSTQRLEEDKVEFTSGLVGDKIQSPYRAVIKNKCQNSKDYSNLIKIPRPSHADYVAYKKYGDQFDYRGGGKFSGRLTAPMCIAGGLAIQALERKGIQINAYIRQIGQVSGASYKNFDIEKIDLTSLDKEFPLLDCSVKEKMLSEIESARLSNDSVGGIIECVVKGVPVGTGEYMFDSLESVISHLAFGVPAVKGIEFGLGFDLAGLNGSVANDSFYFDNGAVKTRTNNNGGINGGIANGMPITFSVIIKPTPSIAKEQETVDLIKKENTKIQIGGRHDSCIVLRAVPVIEAITALAIYDSLE